MVGEPVIRFEDVWVSFAGPPVLRGVSFALERGENLVLLGATGTGKTLLLKLALGLLRPDRGRIEVLGREVSALDEDELFALRAELGMVFQEIGLFDSLSVYENVAYRLLEEAAHHGAARRDEEIESSVREVLRFVGLEEAIWKLPEELSGGMKRRVGLARALISRPPVLLYDSPTAGLDPVTAQTILTLVLKLHDTQQVSSLYVTQRLQDGFTLARSRYDPATGQLKPAENGPGSAARARFLLLRDGGIFFDGSPDELLASRDPYLRRYLT